jgi:NAD(P)-dependent dehydrogenase (short-subunit alcohol dehydrogenase family)
MDLKLHGKVAIVTGASRGIGRAIAQCLSAEGMRLVLAARTASQLEAVAAALPGESTVLPLDLRAPAAPQQLIDFALDRYGTLDLLVNNAGATQRGDFLQLTDEQWADGFALKFHGAMRCARAAWPHLVASRGTLINIVGIGGRTATAEFTIGGAVNAALLNLTKALADRGIAEGVRVNAVNPGSTATDRLTGRIRTYATQQGVSMDEAAARMAEAQGIARYGEPMEIAAAVAFLASAQAAYIHGAVLDVDGGQTRTL